MPLKRLFDTKSSAAMCGFLGAWFLLLNLMPKNPMFTPSQFLRSLKSRQRLARRKGLARGCLERPL